MIEHSALRAADVAERSGVRRDLLPLTTDGVRAIAAIADPSVRNLWITQSYADLGARLARQLGADHSWCTFAVWASNTAGESIRGQELPAFMDELLGTSSHSRAVANAANSHVRWLRWTGIGKVLEFTHIDNLARQAITDVSAHIAHGNTLVYEELAPIFVRFLERFELDTPSLDDMDEVLDTMGVPLLAVEPLVRRAFQYYYRAVHEQDPGQQSQLVLAANISAVLHEQQRLQYDIAAALNACIVNVEDHVKHGCKSVLPDWVERKLVERVLASVTAPLEDLWDHLATAMMMTMVTPDEVLVLHHDVPRLLDGECFPETLQRVHFPDLGSLLDEWDPTHAPLKGSAAADWANLHERMGYIVNLFRSRQQCQSLSQSPFTTKDLKAMQNFELPKRMQS